MPAPMTIIPDAGDTLVRVMHRTPTKSHDRSIHPQVSRGSLTLWVFTLRERLRSYRLPIGLNPSLRHYRRAWLATDVAAGVTVGALTIPSASVMPRWPGYRQFTIFDPRRLGPADRRRRRARRSAGHLGSFALSGYTYIETRTSDWKMN